MDNLNELPQEKRPPELMIWDGTKEEIDEWIKNVFDHKKKQVTDIVIENIEE